MKKPDISRRELLQASAALGCLAAAPLSLAAAELSFTESAPANPLKPPTSGSIPVAFLVSDGAVVIDFCGPWEVFQDVYIPTRKDRPFNLYTVSDSTKPIKASAGLTIVPDYSLETAPPPKVIVIPAQNNASDAAINWLRKSSKTADVTMSVCTGAYILAGTGMLAGKSIATHHSSYVDLGRKYPDVKVQRGARFVEESGLASAGGLSSGIDLAIRVVERYFGRDVAKQVAYDMEYQGQGWTDPNSNSIYAKLTDTRDNRPVCIVCSMAIDPASAPSSSYVGKRYYFCSADHKAQFDAKPAEFINAMK